MRAIILQRFDTFIPVYALNIFRKALFYATSTPFSSHELKYQNLHSLLEIKVGGVAQWYGMVW